MCAGCDAKSHSQLKRVAEPKAKFFAGCDAKSHSQIRQQTIQTKRVVVQPALVVSKRLSLNHSQTPFTSTKQTANMRSVNGRADTVKTLLVASAVAILYICI